MKRKFYAYRYLISQDSEKLSLFEDEFESKEKLIENILKQLEIDVKTTWNESNKKYILTGVEKFEEVYFIKFAKITNKTIYVEAETDINKKSIEEANYIYIIIDKAKQILLIEQNTSLFKKENTVVSLISKFLSLKISKYYLSVNIYPLSTKTKFWGQVDNADKIYTLELKLSAPNMALFASEKAQKILKSIQAETNIEEFDFKLKNKNGNLEIKKSGVGVWIDYVREVGGDYIMRYKNKGESITKVLRSNQDVYNMEIEIAGEEFNEEEKKHVKNKVNDIDKIENRD